MKKENLLALVCLLTVMLCGCTQDASPGETAPSVTEATAVTQPAATVAAARYASAPEAYEAFWKGEAALTDLHTQSQLDIRCLEALYAPAPQLATADTFSIVDLDHDGMEEMILWVDLEYAEYTRSSNPVILRFQEGSLVALALAYEDFQNVKTDGSFLFWYPGQGNLGYATLVFEGGTWLRKELAEARTGDNGEMTYCVNGESVPRGLYRDLELEQNGKADVVRYRDWDVYRQEASAQTATSAGKDDALAAYGAVFRGEQDIYYAEGQAWIPIFKLSQFFTAEDLPWQAEQIAVLDLDGGGSLEAVIQVSDYAGFVILRCQPDGTVTGHGIWYRAFQELKADGSYRGSGSSFNRSYWKSHLAGDILLAECYEDGSGNPVYWLDGKETDETGFLAFEETQNQKPDALWYPSWEDYLNQNS